MGKLRHQQALRLQDVPGSCAMLLYPVSPLPPPAQDHENAGTCRSSQPTGSESKDTAALRVLWGREGRRQPLQPWLTKTRLSNQPGKQSLASCGLYLASRALAPAASLQLAGFGEGCSCSHLATGETEAGMGLELWLPPCRCSSSS